MIDFSRLTSLKFIFNLGPNSMSPEFVKFFYFFFSLFLIMALVAKLLTNYYFKKKDRPHYNLWQKLSVYFLSLGIIGAFLLFFRQQRAYFLSMPFLMYLWALSALIWAGFIFKWIMIRMKRLKEDIKEKEERQKYLP